MLQFYAVPFVRALEELSAIRIILIRSTGEDQLAIDDITRAQVDDLARNLELLEMGYTLLAVQRLQNTLKEKQVSAVSLRAEIEGVQHRLIDELQGVLLLAVSPKKAEF